MHRRFRLRLREDFRRLHRDGRRYHNSLASLLILPNQLDFTRTGFSASRHVGGAVERNYAKRRYRESVRRRLGGLQPGWDCLLIIKPKSNGASFEKIDEAVEDLFNRSGLIVHPDEEENSGLR